MNAKTTIVTFALFALLLNTSSVYSTVDNTCVTQPSQPTCTNYQLPTAAVDGDISSLCTNMPFMPGCTVDKICQEKRFENDQHCVPFSILKDLCIDMPGMSGCKNNYNQMCNKTMNSVVKQCDTKELAAPTSVEASTLIKSICTEMNMDGCEKCTGTGKILNCDVLTVYSDLCLAMPDMEQCSAWTKMCSDIPKWPLCSSEASNTPSMRMYFHTGILDYVLFKGWVPKTNAQYAGTWFAIFLFGIAYEFLKVVRVFCERAWSYEPDEDSVNSTLIRNGFIPFRPSVDIPRAFIQSLEVLWSLLLMLIAMTYNVGLFFAIIAGAFVGTLIFGRVLQYQPKAGCH